MTIYLTCQQGQKSAFWSSSTYRYFIIFPFALSRPIYSIKKPKVRRPVLIGVLPTCLGLGVYDLYCDGSCMGQTEPPIIWTSYPSLFKSQQSSRDSALSHPLLLCCLSGKNTHLDPLDWTSGNDVLTQACVCIAHNQTRNNFITLWKWIFYVRYAFCQERYSHNSKSNRNSFANQAKNGVWQIRWEILHISFQFVRVLCKKIWILALELSMTTDFSQFLKKTSQFYFTVIGYKSNFVIPWSL